MMTPHEGDLGDGSTHNPITSSYPVGEAGSTTNIMRFDVGMISDETPMHASKDDLNKKLEHSLPSVISASHAPTQNSKAFIVFLLLNTMIGSGILNQPEVFQMAGIMGALMSFAVAGSFIWLGLVLLIECGNKFHKMDYSELCEYAFGIWGEKLVDVMIVTNNFGALLSYLIIVGGTSTGLFHDWGCESEGCNVYYTTSLATIFILMPVCSLRFFGHLTYISIFSIMSIAAVLFLVLIGGPIVGGGGKPRAFNGTGGLEKFGSIVFALSCAPASFHAYKSMGKKTDKDWKDVTCGAVVAGAIMCIIMGLAGSLSFGDDTDGDILENFSGSYSYPFKMLLVIHLLLYIPVDFIVMRHSVVRLLGTSDGNLNTVPHLVLTGFLLFLCTTLVLCLRFSGLSIGDSFGLILDFTGGIAGSLTSYVIPASMYLKLMSRADPYYTHAVLMLIFGVFVMIMVPVVSIIYL